MTENGLHLLPGQRRRRRERRIFIATLIVGIALALAVFAWVYGPAWRAYGTYAPWEGDIIFQSLPHGPLVDAIEGASQSPYSHCGIVANINGQWVVYEALGNVGATPLRKFIFRGRQQGFAVYRLKARFQQHVPATLAAAKSYVGRPYDVRYRMDDEQIYCSELIYKAYRETSGGETLGDLVRLGDLHWQPYEATIEHFEGGPVPLDREMITPRDMARADQLELVFVFEIDVAEAD